MRRLLAAVVLTVSILLTSFAAPPAQAASLPADHDQFVARVIELVNVERQRVNQPPLTANAALTRAAQDYSVVLADGTCFDHNCGSTPSDRLAQAGYTNWTSRGENIASGYPTPEAVMAGWMASPGHRGNILSANFKEIGVGVAARSNGTLFWAQTFGSSRSSGNATQPTPTPAPPTPTSTPAPSTPTPTPTPPSDCSTRPSFTVRSTPASPGTLQVTVTAGRTTSAPNNVLRRIRFGTVVNGSINVTGYGSAGSNTTIAVAPGTQQVTFVVHRNANGAGTTVPFTLTDDCGDWQTFVGGGPSAF